MREELERVRTGGERAAKIVRNLLAFARRSSLERSIEDLNEIVRSTLALRPVALQVSKVRVVETYADDLPLVVVSREEIRQVVLNLIVNAEHAIRSAERTGTIRVRTGQAGSSVFVEVTDDGPGVPAASVGRVFEPFFTTKPVNQGTGLGLSVSLGIAQAHEGSLALVPSDVGACFVLTLPGQPAYMPSAVAPGAAAELIRPLTLGSGATARPCALVRMSDLAATRTGAIDTACSSPSTVVGLSRNASPSHKMPFSEKSCSL